MLCISPQRTFRRLALCNGVLRLGDFIVSGSYLFYMFFTHSDKILWRRLFKVFDGGSVLHIYTRK